MDPMEIIIILGSSLGVATLLCILSNFIWCTCLSCKKKYSSRMRSEGFPNKRVIEDDANEAEAGRVENVDHSNEDHFQQGKELIANEKKTGYSSIKQPANYEEPVRSMACENEMNTGPNEQTGVYEMGETLDLYENVSHNPAVLKDLGVLDEEMRTTERQSILKELPESHAAQTSHYEMENDAASGTGKIYENVISTDEIISLADSEDAPQPVKTSLINKDEPYEVVSTRITSCSTSKQGKQEVAIASDAQYELVNGSYWYPGNTMEAVKKQMIMSKCQSFREVMQNEIKTIEELGSGEFGEVFKADWHSAKGKMTVAIKMLYDQNDTESGLKLLQEAAIMGQFDHPNVIKLLGVVSLTNTIIIMEYLPLGDLRNHLLTIKVKASLPMQLLQWCHDIAAAMSYLSGKSFIHRDLAARNILLNKKKQCKISDFGMARNLQGSEYYKPKGGQIPVKWTAPEALLYQKYTTKSDVWSFGMVMFEIWSLGHKPFENATGQEVVRMFSTGVGNCQYPPPGCPKRIYKIMVDCWNPDYHRRPPFSDISTELMMHPKMMLQWNAADKRVSLQASKLGAPIEEGRKLYPELQSTYAV